MKLTRGCLAALIVVFGVATALPQDGLGKTRGGGGSKDGPAKTGGGGSGSGGGQVDRGNNRGSGGSGSGGQIDRGNSRGQGGSGGSGSGLGKTGSGGSGSGGGQIDRGNSRGQGGSGGGGQIDRGNGNGGGQIDRGNSRGQGGSGGSGSGLGKTGGGGSGSGGGQIDRGNGNGGGQIDRGNGRGQGGGFDVGRDSRDPQRSNDRPQRVGENGLERVQRDSRSGSVRYGTSYNLDPKENRSFRIGSPPNRNGVLNEKIRQSESRVGVKWNNYGGYYNGYRVGYVHYNRGWRDDYFTYPWYVFDPYSYDRFACSPWYYYPTLPPYLSFNRIFIVSNYYGYMNWVGQPYVYRGYRDRDRWNDDYGYDRQAIDYALDDLVEAFERNDRRAAGRLVPRRGSVAIWMDGRYQYSLNPDDFYDLFMDGIDNARTRNYDIVEVRRGNDIVRVRARHEYTDPWGQRETVYHDYTLQLDRNEYVVREFGTSSNRW